MAEKAILFDATKCIGCRGCQVACKQWNELAAVKTFNQGSLENPPDLSSNTYLTMKFTEASKNGTVDWLFVRRSCMHCTDAACVEVCPTNALYHSSDGIVSYDKGKCTGCGYCKEFCPFDVPRLDTNRVTGLGRMNKCTLCTTPGLDRISANLQPACVKTCPPEALKYGDREQLAAEGTARVAALKAGGSEAYPNATLYGERELGGLHVLYVLADSPQAYGLPQAPKFPDVATAWKSVIQPLGWAAAGAVAVGLLINLMVARAKRIREQEENNARRS